MSLFSNTFIFPINGRSLASALKLPITILKMDHCTCNCSRMTSFVLIAKYFISAVWNGARSPAQPVFRMSRNAPLKNHGEALCDITEMAAELKTPELG